MSCDSIVTKMKKVALIRCVTLPDPDHDEPVLLDALRNRGFDARLLSWDDPSADAGAFDLCVLRACWNYYEQPEKFLAWIADAARRSTVMNPETVIRWNHHKRYLHEMEEAGIPIIPTEWIDRGESVDFGALLDERNWDDVVVKPAISAGSFLTKRFRKGETKDGQVFLDTLLKERDALVQKYMRSVEQDGERAIVWIDGAFTHAVIKRPRFAGSEESVTLAPKLSDADLEFAEKALARVDAPLLYGRVDVVNDDDGRLLVSELELMEPSLFFVEHPPALKRFVEAIVRLCEE